MDCIIISASVFLSYASIQNYCSLMITTCSSSTQLWWLHSPEQEKTAIVTQSHSVPVGSIVSLSQEAASSSMGINGGINCSWKTNREPHLPHVSLRMAGSGHGQIACSLEMAQSTIRIHLEFKSHGE
jgi:hypothetical protein